jgi:hypothetical protein
LQIRIRIGFGRLDLIQVAKSDTQEKKKVLKCTRGTGTGIVLFELLKRKMLSFEGLRLLL